MAILTTTPKKNKGIPADGEKVAVVTGGANGIGKCIAEEFRKQGIKVCVIDKAAGDHYVGDLSDRTVLDNFAARVIDENGGEGRYRGTDTRHGCQFCRKGPREFHFSWMDRYSLYSV